MQFSNGEVLFRNGDACRGYVLVVTGSICVQKMDPQGHEIVLYRVEKGQSCMLTTTCLLGARKYPAEGVVESDVQLVLFPPDVFDELINKSTEFRRFVMANIGERIYDLMTLVEDVAFGRMDARLTRLLLKYGEEEGFVLARTHKQLAVELGTAREVVSRLLKNFERQGLLELKRNQITFCDLEQLHHIAHQ